MNNPFKFGSVVSDNFFTDRKEESIQLAQYLSGNNHVIMIAPRRFGKTSLVYKVIESIERPAIWLDLQLVTSVSDLASQLLKQLFRKYPFEKLKFMVRNFRIVPTLSVDPVSNNVEISFNPRTDAFVSLEDVLNLIEHIGEEGTKPIVIFDEFQELILLEKALDKKLRAVIQFHKAVNYVFLGSVESMMKQIFEDKKSPFYHFGQIFSLHKISFNDFKDYVATRFALLIREQADNIADDILDFTNCHPYYTQQLAFHVWMKLERENYTTNSVRNTINEIILIHDNDYERIWNNFNNTDKKILIGLAFDESRLLNSSFTERYNLNASSTVFSALKRLLGKGILIKDDKYEFDDPFFREWIVKRRNDNI